jgi:hypothetical protein
VEKKREENMDRRKIVFLGMLFASLFTVCKLARGKEFT